MRLAVSMEEHSWWEVCLGREEKKKKKSESCSCAIPTDTFLSSKYNFHSWYMCTCLTVHCKRSSHLSVKYRLTAKYQVVMQPDFSAQIRKRGCITSSTTLHKIYLSNKCIQSDLQIAIQKRPSCKHKLLLKFMATYDCQWIVVSSIWCWERI